MKYNEAKAVAGQDDAIRPYSAFWSGEKFILNIPTTEAVPAIRVTIDNTDYSVILMDHEITSDGAIYKGELWNADMLNKWGNYNPKELTFVIDVMDGTTVLESISTKVTVDNKDLYYRIRREF